MVDRTAVATLARELRGTRKYSGLADAALSRTAAWALERSDDRRAAGKLARRKLHQAYGAYLPAAGMRAAEREAALLDDEELEVACARVLACHASTRERMPFMRDFFASAFGELSGAVRVADLACGLTPFSIPWMPLAAGARYLAVDFDSRMELLARRLAPRLAVELEPRTADLVSEPPSVHVDVALMLKAVPTLERQAPGAAARLLERVDARRIAISVSAHSLGGRRKGMRERSEEWLDGLLGEGARGVGRVDYPSETLFVLRR